MWTSGVDSVIIYDKWPVLLQILKTGRFYFFNIDMSNGA